MKEKEIKEEKKEVEEEKVESIEKKKDDKENLDSEEVCEVFEVEGKGKDQKEVKSCVEVEKKHSVKDDRKRYGKILLNILIILGVIVVGFFLWLVFLNSLQTTDYKDLKFQVVQQGNIVFYKYVIPLSKNNTHYADYNFYLRRNPPQTGKIPFKGDLKFNDLIAVNMTTDLNCEGDGLISLANMVKPFELIGSTVVNDPNATCDEQGRYMFINIVQGNKNKIVQSGKSCYELTVKDCDVLDVTERFMLETFVKLKEDTKA